MLETFNKIYESIKLNKRLNFITFMLFILFFGINNSVQAQDYLVDRADDNTITTCDIFTANDCTLRGAIQRANTDGVASQIRLAIPQ
nr:hypothetical protein [Pyrinomonadaceae bacterium]